mgnify:CR=1 FL=1
MVHDIHRAYAAFQIPPILIRVFFCGKTWDHTYAAGIIRFVFECGARLALWLVIGILAA